MRKPPATLFALALVSFLSFHVPLAVAAGATSGENPFTPKAYLIRYWNNKIYNVPRSEFLLSKASPLCCGGGGKFRPARESEVFVRSPRPVLQIGAPPLLPRSPVEPREARQ
ncbi:hypothetical protein Dimus_031474 [Dionaea muscipula]